MVLIAVWLSDGLGYELAVTRLQIAAMEGTVRFSQRIGKLQEKVRLAFLVSQSMQTLADIERGIIRFIFETLRNLMVSGLLLFFYVKTKNDIFFYLFFGTVVLIAMYIWSHLEMWVVHPLYRLVGQSLTLWLFLSIHTVVVLGLSFSIYYVLFELVLAIAEGYVAV